MLRRLSGFFVRGVERYMPDPLVIAILLTAVVLFFAVTLTSFNTIQTVDAWGDTFWNLLSFTSQMVLIIVLGHIVAHTGPIQKGLLFLANQINITLFLVLPSFKILEIHFVNISTHW